jgi:hypothetical protein
VCAGLLGTVLDGLGEDGGVSVSGVEGDNYARLGGNDLGHLGLLGKSNDAVRSRGL